MDLWTSIFLDRLLYPPLLEKFPPKSKAYFTPSEEYLSFLILSESTEFSK